MNEAIRLTTDIKTHRIKHEANKPKKETELQKQSNGNKSKEKNKLSKDRNIHNSVQFTNKTLN